MLLRVRSCVKVSRAEQLRRVGTESEARMQEIVKKLPGTVACSRLPVRFLIYHVPRRIMIGIYPYIEISSQPAKHTLPAPGVQVSPGSPAHTHEYVDLSPTRLPPTFVLLHTAYSLIPRVRYIDAASPSRTFNWPASRPAISGPSPSLSSSPAAAAEAIIAATSCASLVTRQ